MKPAKRVTKICENPHCNKEFIVRESQAKNRKYCSQDCFHDVRIQKKLSNLVGHEFKKANPTA